MKTYDKKICISNFFTVLKHDVVFLDWVDFWCTPVTFTAVSLTWSMWYSICWHSILPQCWGFEKAVCEVCNERTYILEMWKVCSFGCIGRLAVWSIDAFLIW